MLHRFLIWCGADLGLPLQFHVGYGDRDVDLRRCNPFLLTGLLRALEPTGTPVILLHNYPYHRRPAISPRSSRTCRGRRAATHNLGHRATALIAEVLELCPFGKFLYSSDGFGLPELHYLGGVLFRRGLSDFLRAGLSDGAWTADDAERIARMAGPATRAASTAFPGASAWREGLRGWLYSAAIHIVGRCAASDRLGATLTEPITLERDGHVLLMGLTGRPSGTRST